MPKFSQREIIVLFMWFSNETAFFDSRSGISKRISKTILNSICVNFKVLRRKITQNFRKAYTRGSSPRREQKKIKI